jgi:hypothetical protein
VVPANQNVLNVAPRNVGMITGFWVLVSASITLTGGGAGATRTDFGPANLLSQIIFTDLNNNVRINTQGWHLASVNTARSRRVFGSAVTTDTPTDFGANYTVQSLASTLATGGTTTATFWYYVPLAYNPSMDLRGSIFANVVNATMNLQLTINPGAIIAAGDSTYAVYTGNAGSITSATVTVFQEYIDQLPMGEQGPILPILDMSQIYMIQNTVMSGMTANQDFPIPYPNFRSFYSTSVIYNQNGTRANGTDVNYWALQSANYTNIWKIPPALAALKTRQIFGDDMPTGAYYFDHREKPIATIQYGNMELILNPISAAAQSTVNVGYEMFAEVNTITGAGSLAGG